MTTKKSISILLCILLILVNVTTVKADSSLKGNDPFFTEGSYIVRHAMGGYGGDVYNNHEVALNNSIINGGTKQFIELDLLLTKDGQLICSHGVNKATCEYTGIQYQNSYAEGITYEEFMKLKIQRKYATMSAAQWSDYVKQYDDIVWELDLRTLGKEDATAVAKAIVKLFKKEPSCYDRLLIQVGSKEMYEAIHKVHEFKYYQYFLHKAELAQISDIIKFCKEEKFVSIAVKYEYMNPELTKKIKDNSLKILCYTVDDVEVAMKMLQMGAECICSNFLYNNDITNYLLNTNNN